MSETETGQQATTGQSPGEAVTSKIRQAQVVFLDYSGEPLFTVNVGRCQPGDTITCKVPGAGDFEIT